MPYGNSDFQPAWWLPGSHSQTLWPYFFHRPGKFEYDTERLELPDGDFVDLCWTQNDSGPLVTVFHGLEGGIRSHYIAGILNTIHNKGWRGVLMHFRGCSGVANRLERSYHSGDTGDIRYLINTLRSRHPATAMAAVGYSLGGNALLKYLAESGKETPLRAAVAVSVPFQLNNCALRLEHGLSRIYQWKLLKQLRAKMRRKFTGQNGPVDIDKLAECTTFRRFDDAFTAPLHGFENVDDYYIKSSSRRYLRHIRIPVLLLHAVDDPFMTPSVIPDMTELSDSVILELSEKGGHAGFVGGSLPWQPEYWLEKRIPEYLYQYLC